MSSDNFFISSSNAWEYTLSVMDASECPSILEMTLMFAPFEIAREAAVWRKSWKVILGNPEAFNAG